MHRRPCFWLVILNVCILWLFSDSLSAETTLSDDPLPENLQTELKIRSKRQPKTFGLHLSEDAKSYTYAASSENGSEPAFTVILNDDLPASIEFTAANTDLAVRMIPLIAGLGKASRSGETLSYFSRDGTRLSYSFKRNGLKEDIVLSHPPASDFELKYFLKLDSNLQAKLDSEGNLRVYGPSDILSGYIQTGDEKSSELVMKARQNAPKDRLLYVIPAPVVIDANGKSFRGLAHYSYASDILTIHTGGLTKLAEPITIDPSIVITTSSDFLQGNDEGMISFDTNSISRDVQSGGTMNAWETTDPTIPAKVQGPAAVAYNGFLYVLGGYTGSGTAAGYLSTVHRATIDPGTGAIGAWSPMASFSTGRYSHTAVVYNGYMYVIGGFFNGSYRSDVQYSPIDSTGALTGWSTTTALGSGRLFHASVAYNGYLYTIGGETAAGVFTNEVLVAAFRGDGKIGNWNPTTTLPSARRGATAVAYNRHLYVIGGHASSGYLSTVHFASINEDGTIDAFVQTSSIPLVRGFHTSVACRGYLYVVGGYNGSSEVNTVYYAPIHTNGRVGLWNSTTAIPGARYLHASAVNNGTLYILGGYDGGRLWNVYRSSVSLNGVVGTWAGTTGFTSVRRGHTTVVYNGYIYILGGQSAASTYITGTGMVRYAPINTDGTIGTWLDTSAFSTPRAGHSSIVSNGYIYMIGGTNGTPTADVQYTSVNSNGTLNAWQGTTNLSSARYGHSSVAYNGYLYVIGGNNGSPIATAEYVAINSNGTLDTIWHTATSLSAGRYNHASAVYNGYLYVIGGHNGTNPQSDVLYNKINSDGSLNSNPWLSTSLLQTTRSGLTVVAYNGYLYAIGGQSAGVLNTVEYASIKWDGTLGTFASTATFTTPRALHTSVVYNGYLYILGGYNGSTTHFADVQFAPLNPNGPVASWTTSSFSSGRAYHGVETWNGYLYVIGGMSSGTPLSDVQYSQIQPSGTPGTWLPTASLSGPRFGLSSAVYNGYLYVTGGGGTADVFYAQVQSGGSLNGWQSTNSFNTGRTNHAAVAYRGYLYILGGHDGSNFKNDVQYAPINPDGTVGTWQDTTGFPIPRTLLTSVAYNGYLYVIGGENGTALNDIRYAPINPDGTIGSWTATTGFYEPRSDHISVAYNGFLYVLSGWGSQSVQYAPIASNGAIGSWHFTSGMGVSIYASDGAVVNGTIYVPSGEFTSSGPWPQVGQATLNGPAGLGQYSKMLDLGSDSVIDSVQYNGTAGTNGNVDLTFATAPSSTALFGSRSSVSDAVSGQLYGPLCGRYLWTSFDLDDLLSSTTTDSWAIGRKDILDYTVNHSTFTSGSNAPVCSGQTLNLSAYSIAGATYSWSGPNGFASSQQNPNISDITTAGAGTYTATATLNGCSVQASTNVVVNTTPSAPTASSNSPVCQGNSINLFASTIAGATYSWTGPNGFSSNLKNPTISGAVPNNAGTYSVVATSNGCNSTPATTNVVVNPSPAAPIISAGGPTTFCSGGSVLLTSSAATGNQWRKNGVAIGGATNQTYPASQTGIYSVVFTDANGCVSVGSNAIGVLVGSVPTAPTAGNNSPICEGSTLQLTSAGGDYSWLQRYDDDTSYSYRVASAIAVDSGGNVYVTGSATNPTSYDYVTIKYASNGTASWVRSYNANNNADEAQSIAVDSASNVYVTGFSVDSNGAPDYATIKYDSNGNQLWVKRYNGPLTNSDDRATAIAVDSSGNVYVTGYSYSSSGSDYATIKYDSNGNQLWASRYNGPAGEDRANALAVDPSGNVYVTGYSTGLGTNYDYATVKYDSNGNQLWVTRYNGSANAEDRASAIGLDSSGNVTVTGYSIGGGTNSDYATVQYDAAGNQNWVQRYNAVNGIDHANALVVDSSGNVYVTGDSYSPFTDYDYATIKYSSGGNQVWVSRYNGSGAGVHFDMPKALALDGFGNIYVTGLTEIDANSDGTFENVDYSTLKYDGSGNLSATWSDTGFGIGVRNYNGSASNYDAAVGIAADPAGNVYVTGSSVSLSFDYATIKYSPTGGQVSWSGPDGFTSTEPNPAISNVTTANAGTYTLTVNQNGCTAQGTTEVVVAGAVPSAAGNTLMLTKSGNNNALSWSTADGALSYNVKRCDSTSGVCSPGQLVNVPGTSWTDTSAPTNAWYTIESVNGCGTTP